MYLKHFLKGWFIGAKIEFIYMYNLLENILLALYMALHDKFCI